MNTAEALTQAAGIIDAEASAAHDPEFQKGMAWASFLVREYANGLPDCCVDEVVDLDVELRDDRYGIRESDLNREHVDFIGKMQRLQSERLAKLPMYENPLFPKDFPEYAPVIDINSRRHK